MTLKKRLMTLGYCNLRSFLDSHSLSWLVGYCVAGSLVFIGGTPASASIMLPPPPGFSFEDLNECETAGSSLGSNQSSNDKSSEDSSPQQSKPLIARDAFSPGGTSSGTSSTSPSNGSGGVSASELGSVAAVYFSKPAIFGWVFGEQRLALPTPPGNDLLRPPQRWNCI